MRDARIWRLSRHFWKLLQRVNAVLLMLHAGMIFKSAHSRPRKSLLEQSGKLPLKVQIDVSDPGKEGHSFVDDREHRLHDSVLGAS